MKKKMLIDATHSEETRVAVVEGNRLEDFDYESQFRKPLKGSIFLAKVTRVEPSLQAAFVNFGGNRHGFLPFSEIHPDYFRIPVSDREELIAEQERQLAEAEEMEKELEEAEAEDGDEGEDDIVTPDTKDEVEVIDPDMKAVDIDDDSEAETEDGDESEESKEDDVEATEAEGDEEVAEDAEGDGESEDGQDDKGRRRGRRFPRRGRRGGRRPARSRSDEVSDDEEEGSSGSRFRFNLRRRYKIQEVIKRGQIMLIQVSKEERGNKGAAVSSYLSLPGRYCVLMPNSPRAGGVSRKIASYKDRNRMREIMRDLEVPQGMSVILRTAGVSRTKTEIRRDLDYLVKLWNNIRELTLQSTAPALIYEEADLIKRAVRDLYTRDIEEIQVAGEDGYKNAKNFMKMMIPSHVRKVKEYKDEAIPLFHAHKVETQITEIGETQVRLPSGGYLVINPTEALVSIDVNSGKSTKERHIEETALKTNLEAAQEVARQLRLRDLGGLVVIDFIDMEDRRNNGKVERKMRDALSNDRARIQMSRISSFGLMELSRQRLNPSLTEAQFELCELCHGTGRVRTADATSILVLRAIEDEGIKGRAAQVNIHVADSVALYILNNKRRHISALEQKYNFEVLIRVEDGMSPSDFRLEVGRPIRKDRDDEDGEVEETEEAQDKGSKDNKDRDDRDRSSSRRRGRRGGRNRNQDRRDDQRDGNTDTDENGDVNGNVAEQPPEDIDGNSDKPKRSSSRRRGGRNKSRDENQGDAKNAEEAVSQEDSAPQEKAPEEEKLAPKRRSRAKKKTDDEAKVDASETVKDVAEDAGEEKKKKSSPRKKAAALKVSNDDAPEATAKTEVPEAKVPEPKEYENVNQAPDKKKRGWWNRLVE